MIIVIPFKDFKNYVSTYFENEDNPPYDDFFGTYWLPLLKGKKWNSSLNHEIEIIENENYYEIHNPQYGGVRYTRPTSYLTLPEYIIKKEKERLEKSTMTNSTSAANTNHTIVGTGCVDASKLASPSTNSTWCPITVSTLGDYTICDTVSTKADKNYVDVSIIETKEYMDERIRGIENLLEELTIAGDPFLSINTNKIIVKDDVKRKEEDNMFNFDFGPCKDSNIKMSTYGLAVKDAAGKWVSYDKANDSIVDVSPLTFGDGKYFYKMPVAIKDIKVGDVIIHEKRPMFVGMICKDGDLSVVDIMSAERKVIMPVKNMFGFNYYTRVVSLMDMGGEAVQPSEDNPFGNPMMFAFLAGEDGLDKLDPMMMFALMGGMGGNMKDMNPMMLAMMLSK